VLPREQCSYVLGNPPFVGKQFATAEQKQDMELVCGKVKGSGVLDYVTGWYFKAAEYIQGTRIAVGLVSTNSISQGEQVGILWNELFSHWHLKIHFAHRTFPWMSESRGKAHVHVVIIGFAAFDSTNKRIYDYGAEAVAPFTESRSKKETVTVTLAKNINPYLVEGNDLWVGKRRQPLGVVEPMVYGSKPVDGGNLLLNDEEKLTLVRAAPQAAPFIRPMVGSDEFINGISRWCIWLDGADPGAWRHISPITERVEKVRRFRLASKKEITQEQATTPSVFGELRQPNEGYLVVPEVSSELRHYIPMGFLSREVIASNLIYTVPGASIFRFGILTSEFHMAWVRAVCGRLESRYRYSAGLAYNNFPWPNPTPAQRARVEEKAQAVLDARAPHLPPRGMSTLADLYDPNTMPRELHRAHTELDRAVERCYRPEAFHSDRERVEYLFRLYEQLTAPLLPAAPRTRGRRTQAPATTPRPVRQRTPGLSDQTQT
jgi:hypothetical protein